MLFNSFQFLFFFVITTILYFLLPHRHRWKLLLAASCFFYMVFRPIYILILFFTIIIDYGAGIFIEGSSGKQRKMLLILSLVSNLGVLALFKYYLFLDVNITDLLAFFNQHVHFPVLSIILPIGLSFHTFQAMSYTIEVYRGKQKAERNFGIYALYVMFYPQLVAGPIERPQNMIHQFYETKFYDFERIKSGLMRMAFGFFKKVVIADRLAIIANDSFNNLPSQNGLSVLISTIAFSFQIYCDFSGYSDIALGAAEVLGFNLMENFRSPYFSSSISEFWSRWHISLSTWFRDYVYIPLGGNRVNKGRWYFNLMMVFVLSGFWHGASWKFMVWGILHGCYLIFAIVKDTAFAKAGFKAKKNNAINFLNQVITFSLVAFAWIFFRANNCDDAMLAITKIMHTAINEKVHFSLNYYELLFSILLVITLLIKEKFVPKIPTNDNFSFFLTFGALTFICYFFGIFTAGGFIYFQF